MVHRFPLLTAAALALAGAASAACSSTIVTLTPADETAMVVRLPAVGLATLSGEAAEVTQLAGGRVALVSLWATWCEACEKEIDALNRLHAKTLEGNDAVVIGVAVGEDREKVAAFAQRRGLRYAQVVDEHFAFADALGQRRLPATLVVDRQGRIVYRGDALDARGLEALRKAIATR
jgi:peroxiredoxin